MFYTFSVGSDKSSMLFALDLSAVLINTIYEHIFLLSFPITFSSLNTHDTLIREKSAAAYY